MSRLHIVAAYLRRFPLLFGLMLAALALAMMAQRPLPPQPDQFDARAYLQGAYHLYNYGVFTERRWTGTPFATLGREPGYAAFLTMLMLVDPDLRSITPACLAQRRGCGAERYRRTIFFNYLLIAASGFLVFAVAHLLTDGALLPSIVSGGHLWLNFKTHYFMDYVISDSLGVFLAALLMFTMIWAWRRGQAICWIVPGLVLAALTLTKAVFLYFALAGFPLLIVIGLVQSGQRRRVVVAALAAMVAFGLPVFSWMARNHHHSDRYVLTSFARQLVSLSVRESYNDISARESLAGLVFWTRANAGRDCAYALFPKEMITKVVSSGTSGSYWNFGIARVRAPDPSVWESPPVRRARRVAQDELSSELRSRILSRPVKHLLVTGLFFWRGMWIDEFIVVSLPALIVIALGSMFRRRYLLLLLFSPGLFSLVFYPLVSVAVPRFQMTTLPALSLALGLATPAIVAWLAYRWRRLFRSRQA